jgi:hypothetical protein
LGDAGRSLGEYLAPASPKRDAGYADHRQTLVVTVKI